MASHSWRAAPRLLLMAAALSLVHSHARAETVKGCVLDARTGSALVANVQVMWTAGRKLNAAMARTNADCTFTVRDVTEPLKVTAWAEGYSAQQTTVERGKTRLVLMRLVRASTVRARILDARGEPLNSGRVRLKPMSPGGSPFGIEARPLAGIASFRNVAADTTYEVAVVSSSCRPIVIGTLRVGAGQHREDLRFKVPAVPACDGRR